MKELSTHSARPCLVNPRKIKLLPQKADIFLAIELDSPA